MTPSPFSYLKDYAEINGGAHRKAASVVGVPAFVRRIGLWNVAAERSMKKPGGEKRWQALEKNYSQRKAAYNRYFYNLQSVIDKSAHCTYDDETFVQRSDSGVHSGTLCVLRFWWRGMFTTVRIEYHAEYITLTSILDLSVASKSPGKAKDGQPDPTGSQPAEHSELDPYLEAVNGLGTLKQLFDMRDRSRDPRDDSELQERYEAIAKVQNNIWTEFESEVLTASEAPEPIFDSALGEVFADFRGMITGSEPSWSANSNGRIVNRMQGPFNRPVDSDRKRSLRHDKPCENLIRDTLKRLWPVIEFESSLRDYEFTAGAFLDGRAIYVSALGPQPRQSEDNDARNAVHYFIHAFTDDEWQIGRLIERINTLGTLRLAASRDVKGLSEVNSLIDNVSALIDEASNKIQKAISSSNEEERSHEGRNDEKGMIKRIDEMMLEIENNLSKLDDTASGDISARLQRSQYYLDQFIQEAEALREHRIEGYQKYQEFVARRMNGAFRYFDLLRSKLKDVNQGRMVLARQYSSLKITSVTLEIGRIQEVGDIVLIGILIPYYVGMVVNHVFRLEEDSNGPALMLGIATAFGGLLVYRRLKHDWRGRSWRKRGWSVTGAFIAYLVVMWVAYGVRHAGPFWRALAHIVSG